MKSKRIAALLFTTCLLASGCTGKSSDINNAFESETEEYTVEETTDISLESTVHESIEEIDESTAPESTEALDESQEQETTENEQSTEKPDDPDEILTSPAIEDKPNKSEILEILEKNRSLHEKLKPEREYSNLGTGGSPKELNPLDELYNVSYDPPYGFIEESEDGQSRLVRINGLKNKDIEEKINKRIDEYVDILLDPAYLPDIAGIIDLIQEYGEDERHVRCLVRFDRQHLFSMEIDLYITVDYHEYKEKHSLNFNLETGDELFLSDIFYDGTDYLNIVRSALQECEGYVPGLWEQVIDFYDSEIDDDYIEYYILEDEYDKRRTLNSIDNTTCFTIWDDDKIQILMNYEYSNKNSYRLSPEGFDFIIHIDHDIQNPVELTDIFESDEQVIFSPLTVYEFGNLWYFDIPDYCSKLGEFDVPSGEGGTTKVEVYKRDRLKREEEVSGEIDINTPYTDEDYLKWAEAFLNDCDKKGITNGLKRAMPTRIYVYPNGYMSIRWEIYGGPDYSYIQWFKDDKVIDSEDLFDVSLDTLLEEMLTVSFHDVSGVTIEDIQKAVKILAPHMIIRNYDPFICFSEFCDDGKETINPIIRENIGSIIDGGRMGYVIKMDYRQYYSHLKIYEGYEFHQ